MEERCKDYSEVKKKELTSCTTLWSRVKTLGNNQGTKVPMVPNIKPSVDPMIISDFSSILA